MDGIQRLTGSGGCYLVVGASATAMPDGMAAYACIVRVDATQIKSISTYRKETQTTVVVTNKSYESVALSQGDMITFDFPVTSITLNGATDSVIMYLEPLVS